MRTLPAPRQVPADVAEMTIPELRDLAERAGRELEGADPFTAMRWAVDTFGDAFCLASSFGDGLLTHVASRVKPGIPVLFLETGYHFPETLGTRDAIEMTYGIEVVNAYPTLTTEEQDFRYGKDLFARDPDRCCAMRKVQPMARALAPYLAWGSGIRRDESPSRANTPVVGWDAKLDKVKVSPLAYWTQATVDAYMEEHDILVNLLVSDGYASIGCAPCTAGWRRARTRARAAGPAATKTSAVCTPEVHPGCAVFSGVLRAGSAAFRRKRPRDPGQAEPISSRFEG